MTLEFQIYDFIEDHEVEEMDDDTEEEDNDNNQVYIIHTFGRTENGKSVYMKIKNYTPYFFIKLPESWSQTMAKRNVKRMYQHFTESGFVWHNSAKHLIAMKVVEKMSPEGFTNGKKFLFAQLIFNNYKAMKSFRYKFENKKITIDFDNGKSKYKREYNYNIDIYNEKDDNLPKTFMINGVEYGTTHKLKIREITKDKYVACILRDGHIAIDMDKYRRFMKYNTFYEKIKIPMVNDKPFHYKTYEANLQPMLRCFHIRGIKGCGWVRVEKYYKVPKNIKETHCDIEIHCDWRKVESIEKDYNAPLRILSYDIECFSHDGEFPQASRKEDPIIQIGSTYTYIGQSDPYRQHIVCLGKTSDIDGAIVESYETEKDLIKGWIREVINSDCDIITGYNIFYFDEAYIYDRCRKILNMENEIKLISKFKDRECNFRDFKLASSAMGENRIRMFDTPGRIHIDLMKDVQKTYKLDSYKLDNVSSNFIRGQINEIKDKGNYIYDLHCKKINDIFVEDFIHIEQVFDFISNNIGKKYKVINIDKDNNILTIQGDIDIQDFLEETHYEKFKMEWSQAKDDVGPKDIFRLWQGNADEKAIVAKYCIKDCRLVGLLLNKLEVVTKNIEMANVCYVPLSFLFTRGQIIKLFSFCMKVFRDEGYVFPVLTKSEEKMPSYEGAIVFDPEPTVEYEALAVKDYSSLYPSSIIHKNMSHETIVYNDKYDNLEGVEYFNAKFVEYDGSIQYRRFAKVNGELGIVPKILTNLLGERKAVKKLMKNETDPFKKNILDCKQLALKITANSLYGGLGADISPVCQRDIAACTTSTGREMLIFAKEYDENIVPGIFNGIKYALMEGREDVFNKIIERELKNKDEEFIKNLREYITKDMNKYTFQPIIRYGDSVIGSTPLLLKKGNEIFIENIENLYNKYSDKIIIFEKEYKLSDDIMTWTEKGWTNIKNIMKHKLEKSKKLYRITTHQGSVVVTDDHSLLDRNGNKVTIKNLKVGDYLLHSFPNIDNNIEYEVFNVKLNKDIARLIGFFIGDGSCGYYENCKKASWALNNSNIKLLEFYKSILEKYFTNFEWKILDTIKSSNVYKLVIKKKKEKIITFIKKFRDYCYNGLSKKVPDFIINSCYDIRYSFWLGLYDADGFKMKKWNNDNLHNINYDINKCGQQIDQKNQITSLGIFTIAKTLGFEVSINTRKDKKNIFRIRVSDKLRKPHDIIKKIEEWTDEEEFVYDLTTDNHHFHAGVGSIIVHNTDSIFSSYKIREKNKLLDDEKSLELWKEIIKFSERLISYFLPIEYKFLWEENHQTYYRDNLIKELSLPKPPDVKPHPTHHNIILPIEDRLLQFLKEYMEEFYLPWVWTLQNIFNRMKDDIVISTEVFKELLDIKLFKHGEDLIRKMRIEPEYIDDNIKNKIYKDVEKFIYKKLKRYVLQPYWDIVDDNVIHKVKIYKSGKIVNDIRNLELSLDMGRYTGELVKSRLPFPHDLEYEKTFFPFLILTKKRYVGNKYEFDKKYFKQDYNGIVLVRRDNPPIVKKVCGGIINYLINERSPEKAKQYTIDCIQRMINNEYNIKYFITSKTLKMKSSYSDWTRQAHVVLADRIEQRDPGNCPQSGDRIEYVAIKVPYKKDMLQGERIETPEYIKEKKLEIDYEFYITNQIMKPALQFLELVFPNAKEEIFKPFLDKFKEIRNKEMIERENLEKGRTNLLTMGFIS
jgi:DNA polymerase elongation subunit (family B)